MRARTRRGRLSGDAGTVTAELAVALTALVPALLAVVGLVTVLLTQLSVTGAASSAARLLARGEDRTAVEEVVQTAAGPGARLDLRAAGGLTQVSVSRRVPLPGGSAVQVTGTAVAPTEESTHAR